MNLLSGRTNPVRHKLYLPGYLTPENESAVLAELAKARPGAIVIWLRPTSEYGHSLFGKDYGRRIRRWVDENYVASGIRDGTPHAFDRLRALPEAWAVTVTPEAPGATALGAPAWSESRLPRRSDLFAAAIVRQASESGFSPRKGAP